MAKRRRKILLHASPFFTMAILSPGEVYKRETYGLLFSFSNQEVINLAYPFQTTERRFTRTDIDFERHEYLKRIAENSYLNFVGDFHSHTDGYHDPAVPDLTSKEDLDWLKENPGLISIVFAINSRWNHLKVNSGGLYYNNRTDKYEKINLVPSKRLENILKKNGFTLSELYIEKQKKDKIKNK